MAGSVSGKNNLMNSIMWQPSKDYAKNSQMTAYIKYVDDNYGLHITDYFQLYKWSIEQAEIFWESFWG